jgi:asparagine synthase (glutamine-hydrolysing)
MKSAALSPAERYLSLASLGYQKKEKNYLLVEAIQEEVDNEILKHFKTVGISDELTQTFYSDSNLVLEGDMLAKLDRACMINSLEARVPFLDSKIVDFSFKLPHHFKIQGINKKRILKDTFADLLPEETLSFSKKGFDLPTRIWFQNELKSELMFFLDADLLKKQDVFSSEYINSLVNEHMLNKENHSNRLWLIFVFQKWYFNYEK